MKEPNHRKGIYFILMKQFAMMAMAFMGPFIATGQSRLDFQMGAHRSTFIGMIDGPFGYLAYARPIYHDIDSFVYKGNIVQRSANQVGLDYAVGLRKNIGKNIAAGIYLGFSIYKHEQYRYYGKSETYPFSSWPPGIDVYQGFVFRDNFVTLSGALQYLVVKNIAIEISPTIWRRESARYEASASTPSSPGHSLSTIFKTNPDHKSWGFSAKSGLLLYPQNDISVGFDHQWFMSGINAQSNSVHKSYYSAWGVKVIYSLKLKNGAG